MLEINEKFKNLLPRLAEVEFKALETSILEESCRTPIQVWNNQIVDGHNRYEICQKHNLPYEVEELDFPDEDAVCEWMIRNQLGRRNLQREQQLIFIGQMYKLRKKRVGASIGNTNAAKIEATKSGDDKDENNLDTMSKLNSEMSKTTAQDIAGEQGVSERTVRRAEKIADAFEKVDEETKTGFLKGDVSQKDLVKVAETKKEEPVIESAPKEYSAGKNTETEYMCFQAYRLKELMNGFKKKLDEITKAQPPSYIVPKPLAHLYEQAEEICINFNNDCNDVRNQFVCEYCEGTSCEDCTGGYVSIQARCFQTAKIKENPSLRGHFKRIDVGKTEIEP